VTKKTCAEAGTWLGKGEDVTIIDTPGFGDEIKEDEKMVNELVDKLKNDVQWINAFVIVFNGQNPRFTYSLRSMVTLFERMFGSDFWKNVIFLVSHWHYSPSDIDRRNMTEEEWTRDRNKVFAQFDLKGKKIDSVFIDSHYNNMDLNEKNHFVNNTEKLWNFANDVDPFHCKDIKTALSEIQQFMEEADKLKIELEEEKKKSEEILNELEECQKKF